jgi:protein TonB
VLATPRSDEAPNLPVPARADDGTAAESVVSERGSAPPQATPVATPSSFAPGAAPTLPEINAGLLHTPTPRYPASARRRGDEGKVTLKVLVTVDGGAARVELEKSSGSASLDSAARDAVNGWRFVPARRGAEAVEAWVLVSVVFRLEGGSY